MIDLIMLLLAFVLGTIIIALIMNNVGEKLEKWLEEHFPDIEE